jgi:hypothetical protein
MGIVDYTKQGSIGTGRLPKRYDLEIYKGDTLDEIFTFKDVSNVAVNLTGFTALVEFKALTAETIIATPTMTVNYNGNGNVRMYIADTTSIPEGTYRWDLQLTDGAGSRRTYIGGQVLVTGDVSD